jgi:amidohydrolase
MSPTSIEALVAKYAPEVTDLRHHIHKYPELSNREFKTAALVAEHLKKVNLNLNSSSYLLVV